MQFAKSSRGIIALIACSVLVSAWSPAAHCGDMLATGWSSSNVVRYDALTGANIDIFIGTGQGGLTNAHSVVQDADGHLYVTSTNSHAVKRYDGQTGDNLPGPLGAIGTAQFVPPGNGLSLPHGIGFGSDGNFCVCSFGNARVLRYNGATGAFMGIFAQAGGVVSPSWVTFVCLPGDCTCDDEYTSADHACFVDCLAGPQEDAPFGCSLFDLDANHTIDAADFAELPLLFDQ